MRDPNRPLDPSEISWILEDKIRNGPFTSKEPNVLYTKPNMTAEDQATLERLKSDSIQNPADFTYHGPWPWPTAASMQKPEVTKKVTRRKKK